MGTVGKSIYKGFSYNYNVFGYDKNPLLSPNKLFEVVNCDIVFLCLPTPSLNSGEADVSFIFNAIEDALPIKDNDNTVFVLKSTVPIGTTTHLEKKYLVKVVHSPEFLSAKTANLDFITSNRVIIGSNCESNFDSVSSIFIERFPGINVIKTTPEESEFIKYFLNCFYATKISYFNEMRLLSDKLSLNWESVISGVLSSGWVEKMHTNVPGHDGKFGFGGACFPKDTKALSFIFKQNNINSLVLDAAIEQNNKVRGEDV